MNESGKVMLDPAYTKIALLEGLRDCMSPYVLATTLVFIIVLSVYGRSIWRVVWLGTAFIGTSIIVQFTSALGYWDTLMTDEQVLGGIRITYFIIAIHFILTGLIELLDWLRYRKNADIKVFRIGAPSYLRKIDLPKRIKRILIAYSVLMTSATMIAFFATLMSTITPQSEFIYVLHSHLLAGGDRNNVYSLFLLYCCGISALLFVTWIKILWMAFRKKESVNTAVYYKLVTSALFLSTGLGLTFFHFT